jgi:hypothetical protein
LPALRIFGFGKSSHNIPAFCSKITQWLDPTTAVAALVHEACTLVSALHFMPDPQRCQALHPDGRPWATKNVLVKESRTASLDHGTYAGSALPINGRYDTPTIVLNLDDACAHKIVCLWHELFHFQWKEFFEGLTVWNRAEVDGPTELELRRNQFEIYLRICRQLVPRFRRNAYQRDFVLKMFEAAHRHPFELGFPLDQMTEEKRIQYEYVRTVCYLADEEEMCCRAYAQVLAQNSQNDAWVTASNELPPISLGEYGIENERIEPNLSPSELSAFKEELIRLYEQIGWR